MNFPLNSIRSHFPALNDRVVFLDNPGGTQICQTSLNMIQKYLVEMNANHEGAFPTSQASDQMVQDTREAMADFFNAKMPEEIIFGANMTTLTFHISRSLARWLKPGDRILVTHLDHDANISPWLKIAEDRECEVDWVGFHPENGKLDLDAFRTALDRKPKIVAVGYASNALGTINPLQDIIPAAHSVGALVYIDAVQYAPHGPIDVQELGCDFLVCSSYKFFGPHLGILYGKYEILERLEAYRVRPSSPNPPGKFETGTGCFENISGLKGTLDYFEWIGKNISSTAETSSKKFNSRISDYHRAMRTIQSYEIDLSRSILAVCNAIPGLTLHGISNDEDFSERVPTFSVTHKRITPQHIAKELGRQGIYVWDGNFYALAVTERLGLEEKGGLLRIGATHYNSLEEISRLENALFEIVKG